MNFDTDGPTKLNSVALVRERTIPTERPPLVPTFLWSAQRIPTVVNLGFINRSRYFSFK
jgi:hypothetical protein